MGHWMMDSQFYWGEEGWMKVLKGGGGSEKGGGDYLKADKCSLGSDPLILSRVFLMHLVIKQMPLFLLFKGFLTDFN